ncbi:MAG: hypothetical protein H5T86_00870 [Armatimonadetes bacterium]|nr:hypothetical protein [Armatimonadota bacterium]
MEVRSKHVLAFYYLWYGTPQVSGQWVHWRRDASPHEAYTAHKGTSYRFTGATAESVSDYSFLGPDGLPLIQAKNHPAIGLYDSNDPLVLRSHLKLASEAGIDAFIASWWGIGDFTDNAMARLMDEADALGQCRVSVYYETVPEHKPERAAEDLKYVLERYGSRDAFFKVNASPVIFLYGRVIGELSTDQWAQVIGEVRAEHEAIFIADTDAANPPPQNIDGLHLYNPCGRVQRGEDMKAFYAEKVAEARDKGLIACATVIPGYDDTHIRAPGTVAPRLGGQLYCALWEYAIAADPDWVLITSWNEWHEGSEIEPSVEDRRLYIDLTAKYAARFKRE